MLDGTAAPAPGRGGEVLLTHHDGDTRTVVPVNREVAFPPGELIVSQSDLSGVITRCNAAFVHMSGYRAEELIGQPHHLLRHPDMPSAAFADLWWTLRSGQRWAGYVKNLRKDGAFYWVFASVVPTVRRGEIVGYTSVRRAPSRARIREAAATYAGLLAAESPSRTQP